ncbi:MAG: hypothetical protein M3046_15790 [Actinomycetota bacterium]|nr:hypothetical protein [Actinomycetota bacterium]
MSTGKSNRPNINLPSGSQAEMYLSRALEEFHRASNGPDLWVEEDPFLSGSFLAESQALMAAQNRRLQALRTSVLFAAITVEAFANEFSAEALGAPTARMIDKLSPADKIETAIRLATGDNTILDRGRNPMQTITALIGTRNRLVHPKPTNGLAAWTQALEDSDEEAFGPKVAEQAILAVADLIVLCVPCLPHPNIRGGLAKMIVQNKDLLTAHRQSVGPTIRDLPTKDTEGTAPLHHQMRARIRPRKTGPAGDTGTTAPEAERAGVDDPAAR